MRAGDTTQLRKARGAFFTPDAIALHLAEWAVHGDPSATVLDPTCGEAVFLLNAARSLRAAGADPASISDQLFGVDLHQTSLDFAAGLLAAEDAGALLIEDDFFAVPTPDQLGSPLPFVDAVVGNPPFVRYQQHIGADRVRSAGAALKQGVRLSGLASSWAALLVHSCAFLKPEGRLAMVLPAELLTVGYAEPIRAWLRERFEKVHLVMFERLQFEDALEKVVLVLAEGSGGCDAFSLYHAADATDLPRLRPYDNWSVTPAADGKWTDLLLSNRDRQLFRQVQANHFTPLGSYGSAELGSVTGGNAFFALSESTREKYGLTEAQLVRISPPGTKHFSGTTFSRQQWERLRDADKPVWLLHPSATDCSPGLKRYIASGEAAGVHEAYKCQIRSPWWRPPVVKAPDLFFTYMSHLYPRLVTNSAGVSFLNSMHGVRLRPEAPAIAKLALPLLCLNSVTMLGAEVFGRSYGGGILKMEPREATSLPMPSFERLEQAWKELRPAKDHLDRQLKAGDWSSVVKRVDAALLGRAAKLGDTEIARLLEAARDLRARRVGER